jgi:hypothetical protein
MSRCAIGVLILSTLASAASAAEPAPADFAFGMPVLTPADAAAYKVALPMGVYRDTVREDLGDVRVFNAPIDIPADADRYWLARATGLNAPAAQTDLSMLPTAVTVQRATLGERRRLGGPARLVEPGAFPWKRTLLWAVLALSVCLLAWMAYRLSKEQGARSAG